MVVSNPCFDERRTKGKQYYQAFLAILWKSNSEDDKTTNLIIIYVTSAEHKCSCFYIRINSLQIISKRESMLCTICEKNQRNLVTYPCSHCVMCDACSTKKDECPFCHVAIAQKNVVSIPL